MMLVLRDLSNGDTKDLSRISLDGSVATKGVLQRLLRNNRGSRSDPAVTESFNAVADSDDYVRGIALLWLARAAYQMKKGQPSIKQQADTILNVVSDSVPAVEMLRRVLAATSRDVFATGSEVQEAAQLAKLGRRTRL